MNVNEHIIREQLDTFLAEGNYEACRELLLSDEEVVDKVNELAIAKCMLVVCEQEKKSQTMRNPQKNNLPSLPCRNPPDKRSAEM